MKQLNNNGTTKISHEDIVFNEFLSVALSPTVSVEEALKLALASDLRTLTELPPLTFCLNASYDSIEDTLIMWKEFFIEQFPHDAIGEYVLDMSENKGERKYVLYGNDAFLKAYIDHLDEVTMHDSTDDDTNVIFGEFNSVESLLVEIQSGKVDVEFIDMQLPAGF